MRYSYVFKFPDNQVPFDKPEYRWQSFLGEFVAPLVKDKHGLQFWFSFYGSEAKFRVRLNGCNDFEPELHALRDKLGLVQKEEEQNLTLVQDLGASRFILQNKGPQCISRRADLVLGFLHATCCLYLDTLIQRPDKYWEMEATPDKENPLGNNFESLAHLVANISRFEFDVFTSAQTAWMNPQLLQRIRCRLG